MPEFTLHLGDCLEYMRSMPDKSVDAVITDPPYGVGYKYNTYQDSATDLEKLISDFTPLALRVSNRAAVFSGVKNQHLYTGSNWTYAWVCPAGNGVSAYGFTCWTPIFFYGKDVHAGRGSRPDVFVDYNPKRTGVDHPCEKPLSVMLWSIERFTLPETTVFDPFMGSGTTGVACMKLNRNFIGCEIDPTYYAIAEKRIKEAAAQPVLF